MLNSSYETLPHRDMNAGVRSRVYAELFAGAGGLSLGLERAGWTCAFHAENAAAPRAILKHHWPDTPLYGDVVALSGGRKMKQWLRRQPWFGTITLVSGGSPCQDLSVAGKRAGLGGLRSSLFFRQMRLWKILNVDLCLWENVDGARSSNEGRDFAEVLRAFVGAPIAVPSDGWRSAGVAAGPTGVAAWRVLDAQFFGVPQRRRRVFVLGTRTGSIDPAEVLSLAEGVRGNSSSRREAREGVAADAGSRVAFSLGSHAGAADGGVTNESHGSGGPVGFGIAEELANTLRAGRGGHIVDCLAFDWQNSASMGMECRSESDDSLRTNAVPAVVAFDTTQITHPENRSNPQPGDPCHPLAAAGHAPVVCLTGDVTHSLTHEGHDASEDGTGRGTPIVATPLMAGGRETGPHGALDGDNLVVAFNETGHEKWTEEPIAGSLNAHEAREAREAREAHTIVTDHEIANVVALNNDSRAAVTDQAPPLRAGNRAQGAVFAGIPRRLTPVECERLMSWPDHHTLVPDAKGKLLSDAARYKACGNGVASVHSHWIGWRLRLALQC